MDAKMVPKRHLGEILASSKPSWAILGLQQASLDSFESTMIANGLSRGLLGGILVFFKALQGPFLVLLNLIQGLPWATWMSHGVC